MKFQGKSYKTMTRPWAAAMKETLYWSGTQCSNGHESPRYTRDDVCKKCYQEKRAAYNARKKEKVETANAEIMSILR